MQSKGAPTNKDKKLDQFSGLVQGVHVGSLQALGFTQQKNDKIISWNFILGLCYTLIQGSWCFRSLNTPGSVFLASKLPEGIFAGAETSLECFLGIFYVNSKVSWWLDVFFGLKISKKEAGKAQFLPILSRFRAFPAPFFEILSPKNTSNHHETLELT